MASKRQPRNNDDAESIIAVPRDGLEWQRQRTDMTGGETLLVGLLLVILIPLFPITFFLFCKTIPQSHAGVIRRFGRWSGELHAPGLVWIVPGIDELEVVDMRMHTFAMVPQEMLTQDSVTINVDAIIYYQITSVARAVFAIDDVHNSTKRLGQAALRDVVGSALLQDIVSHRQHVCAALQKHMEEMTTLWGIKVAHVDIKDITLPAAMQRSMSAKAEAVREADAKVAAAQGEKNAAVALREAADEMMKSPGAMQLRYLQTLATIATENNSTIVFPMPVDSLTSAQMLPLAAARR